METDKKVEGAVPKVSPSDGSTSHHGRRLLSFISTPKRQWISLLIIVLIAGLGGWAYYHKQSDNGPNGPKTAIKSEAQAEAQELKQVQASAPANAAGIEEKLKYYDKLFYAQSNAEDYKGAAATFKQRQGLSTEGLHYYDYFAAAQAYCKLKDKESARKAFSDLRAVLPANDDPATDYSRAGVLNSVDFMSKECGL